jgi:phage FluMu protein Com
MIDGNSNFMADHGALILFPLAGLAVAIVVYLVIDGIHGCLKRKRIAQLCKEARQDSTRSIFLPAHPPPDVAAAVDYFATTCHHCTSVLVMPESLRFAVIACPQCKEMVHVAEVKAVAVGRNAEPQKVAASG